MADVVNNDRDDAVAKYFNLPGHNISHENKKKRLMSEYVSSAPARMYIGVKFVAIKEIIKFVLVFLRSVNVEQKARFCIITDEAYKVKRYVKSIVISFLSRHNKVVYLFPFGPCNILFIDTHASFWILYYYQVILQVWCFCSLFGFVSGKTPLLTRPLRLSQIKLRS